MHCPSLRFTLQSFDSLITEERIRYASQRVDFHDYFDELSVPAIQRILSRSERDAERKAVVVALFRAQQTSPHRLWTLLLAQAMGAVFLQRRRGLSDTEDPVLDTLVLHSFLDALGDIPTDIPPADIQRYVLTTSAKALTRRTKRRRAHATQTSVSSVTARTPQSIDSHIPAKKETP